MDEAKPRRTRDERRKHFQEKSREVNNALEPKIVAEDRAIDAMFRKSIKDHGA
jgi:hypothetical protein